MSGDQHVRAREFAAGLRTSVAQRVDGFETMAGRLVGEVAERVALGGRRMPYHVAFLDDYVKAILPHDVVLIGAPTGIGKTELAMHIATTNAAERNVAFFALEAEPREIERRKKYALLLPHVWRSNPERARDMNFTEWMLGDYEDVCAPHNRIVDIEIARSFGSMQTYYRGSTFGAKELVAKIDEVHAYTDLIVIDHLHYIDDDEDDHGSIVKRIRDCALAHGKPVIVVAHMRKKDSASSAQAKKLVSALDDFHGSSNVTKIATQAIVLEVAPRIEGEPYNLAPTFVQVLKDRRQGPCRQVARVFYDMRMKEYRSAYTLGYVTANGSKWEALGSAQVPAWARRHEPLTAQTETGS